MNKTITRPSAQSATQVAAPAAAEPGYPAPETDYKGRSIAFYHPNGKGTGSALRLEPRINRTDRDRYNCFFVEMAVQKTPVRREGGATVPATFDWENKITVKLGFLDLAEILAVLEGRCESAGSGRNGLYHASGGGNTLITFQANREQGSYLFALSGKRAGEATPRKVAIALGAAEAIGLRCLLQVGLFFITFPGLMPSRMAVPASVPSLAVRAA
jgi:hypothetical protein